MRLQAKIWWMTGASLVLIALFLLVKLNPVNLDYVLPRRGAKITAIVLTGTTIAFASVIFQTITNNRILTPSVMGLDSLYVFIQSVIAFVFGTSSLFMQNANVNFLLCVIGMVAFSGVLYRLMFRRENQNIYFLLLIGMILGSFFSSLSTFMQVLIDPNEFLILQNKLFASFNKVNTDLLWLALIGTVAVFVYVYPYIKYFNVLALGKDHAVNLGIDYDRVVKRLLLAVAVLVSISTALVGPILFLGLLVVNLAREFLPTYRHSYLIAGTVLIAIITLVGGQFIVERIFAFSTPLSVIVNFFGGSYFLYLLLRGNIAR